MSLTRRSRCPSTKSFADIQRFDFNGTAELRAWLSALSAQATAKADGCDALCAGAKRVVTLVTCSANFAAAARGPSRYSSADFSDKHVTPWKRGTKKGIKTGIKR